jgi:hypothetical protein
MGDEDGGGGGEKVVGGLGGGEGLGAGGGEGLGAGGGEGLCGGGGEGLCGGGGEGLGGGGGGGGQSTAVDTSKAAWRERPNGCEHTPSTATTHAMQSETAVVSHIMRSASPPSPPPPPVSRDHSHTSQRALRHKKPPPVQSHPGCITGCAICIWVMESLAWPPQDNMGDALAASM